MVDGLERLAARVRHRRLAVRVDGRAVRHDGGARSRRASTARVLRLRDDGKPAAGNPFAKQAGARPEVFSMGHRDQLGLTVHPNGAVLAAEHGPNGGDEVNLILPGRNYGWPT